MTRKKLLLSSLVLVIIIIALGFITSAKKESVAALEIGKTALDFTGTTSQGEMLHLSNFKGQTIVLEWFNKGCPFTKKHYNSGNMQNLQHKYKEDTVWITIISSAPGKQGHVDANGANQTVEEWEASPDYVILDETGEIGKLYQALTTPHMFIIDTNFDVVYNGAIDSNSSPDPRTIETAVNYVDVMLAALIKGQAVEPQKTRPYGCGIKY